MVLGIASLYLFSMAVRGAALETDIHNCIKWFEEAKEIEGYYITPSQDAQCRYHGIQIDAPIELGE